MKIRKNIELFLPLLLFAVAVIVSGILFTYIVAPSSSDGSLKFDIHLPKVISLCDNNECIQSFDELKYRMLWAMSVLFFVLAYIINFYFVLQVLLKLKAHKKWLLISLGLLASVKTIGIIFNTKLLPAEIDFIFNNYLLSPLKKNDLIDIIVSFIEYGGALMLFVLAFTCFLILVNIKLEGKESRTNDTMANILFKYDRDVRLLLYGATLTLIAGTLHSAAIYNWSLTMLEPGVLISNSVNLLKYYQEASQISGTMGAINGIFYSILMISIFAPTFAIIRKKSKVLAVKANPNKPYSEVQNWLKARNLDQGFSEQILPILSTLGPAIIGGPLITLLELM